MAQSTKKQSILEKFSAGWLVEILMALATYRGYTHFNAKMEYEYR